MTKKIIILIAMLSLPALLFAAVPRPEGFVTDNAGVLDAKTRHEIDAFLGSFARQTGIQVAVATVKTLDEIPIEDYAVELFKKWGIGKKGKDNGVLFLVAPSERKMRIEVGYGLEGALNDAAAGRIMDEAITPRFRQGDISGGIAAGTLAIVRVIITKEDLNFTPDGELSSYGAPSDSLEKSGPLGTLAKVIILIVAGFIFIRHPWLLLFFLSSGRGGSGRGFGGGFGGGGFGGFGGGMSGGGGASRGW
jgi:uncharacterized protein